MNAMRAMWGALAFFSGTATAVAAPAVVGYFSKEPAAVFDTKVKPFFATQSKCPGCEIRNLTPYNSKGEYNPDKLVDAIEAVPQDVSFLFFDWNERSGPKNKEVLDALNQKISEGRLLIASAGVPPTNEGTCPLNRTLMGQANDAIIIGELVERDLLLAQCYYGPEMLSAIRPPKELMGQGMAPLYFVSRLAGSWNKRKPQDWSSYLKARKNKSKRLWPELEEFFPR
ncbi:MAG: hypothetical protein KF802_03350 [Bdellovibrionaceae bacterium]|nr:hypothetical protein [Pseudobdellovibrionaceae bacterium]MBX3033343.1 hypothetical protein [Pseudobdellovibrionaceae bacterium]